MERSAEQILEHAGNTGALTVSYLRVECRPKDDFVWFAVDKSSERMTGHGVPFTARSKLWLCGDHATCMWQSRKGADHSFPATARPLQ